MNNQIKIAYCYQCGELFEYRPDQLWQLEPPSPEGEIEQKEWLLFCSSACHFDYLESLEQKEEG